MLRDAGLVGLRGVVYPPEQLKKFGWILMPGIMMLRLIIVAVVWICIYAIRLKLEAKVLYYKVRIRLNERQNVGG